MKMQESGEMYLETILILSQGGKTVRSIDIAEYMGYSKPSISRAVGRLREDDYISVDKDGYITLTDKGSEVATKIYERHNLLACALERLGVDPETAAEDACRMEHVISDKSVEALKRSLGCEICTDPRFNMQVGEQQ